MEIADHSWLIVAEMILIPGCASEEISLVLAYNFNSSSLRIRDLLTHALSRKGKSCPSCDGKTYSVYQTQSY